MPEKAPLTVDEHVIDINVNQIAKIWQSDNFIAQVKQFQQDAQAIILTACEKHVPIKQCLKARSLLIDAILLECIHQTLRDYLPDIAVFAVGGYGRQELHPHSDIDLVITHTESLSEPAQHSIEALIRQCWDMGLKVGHIVATIKQCQELARVDSTQYNNMMERRPIWDTNEQDQALGQALGKKSIWPISAFLKAKIAEQQMRHQKYSNNAYALEPNIKSSPGGLRDIQTIFWLAKRCLKEEHGNALVENNYLSTTEYAELICIRNFFWRVRFFLHASANRAEDRLLFDHQIMLSEAFGFQHEKQHLGVEAFMKHYYRQVKMMRRINETVIQRFEENILYPASNTTPKPLNNHFQVRHERIELIDEDGFEQNPNRVFELFLNIAQRPELKGIRAETLRHLQTWLNSKHHVLKETPIDPGLFLQVLKSNQGLMQALRLMNKYGVIGAYIPEFQQIEGMMQFDLFHMYTVDSHTLQVINVINDFLLNKEGVICALGVQLMQQCPNPEILYIAALFHDIAKGQDGDHSILGARAVEQFCNKHNLSTEKTKLISWLVEHHLLMSATAQRKDIADPHVITEFANQVNTVFYLNHLYILTVADITATNPKLWNSWRHTLLKKLYAQTLDALEQKLTHPDSKASTITKRKEKALQALSSKEYDLEKIEFLFSELGEDYFTRYNHHEIIRHTPWLLKRRNRAFIQVHQHISESATDIFIHIPYRDDLFARVTAILGNMRLSIVAARIVVSKDNYCLDTFTVLQHDGTPITSNDAIERIKKRLKKQLIDAPETQIRRRNKEKDSFRQRLRVNIETDHHHDRSVIHIQTNDRPGLLATIATVFKRCSLKVLEAKIATLGENAEDTFFVSSTDGHFLSKDKIKEVKQLLREQLA